MNPSAYPFKLRKHGEDIIELSVDQPIQSCEHQAFKTLQQITQKIPYVIFSLTDAALLDSSLAPLIENMVVKGMLLIVSDSPERIPFALKNVKIMPKVNMALRRISTDRVADGVCTCLRMSPFNPAALSLLELVSDPEVTFLNIEKLASQDPNLVSEMLKIAGNLIVSSRIDFKNLEMVVKFLGIEGIRHILIQEIYYRLAKVFPNQVEKLIHMRRCSILCAFIGKLMGCDHTSINKLRSAGLMHDIGALALSFHDNASYTKLIKQFRAEKLNLCEIEYENFGIDHQELGGELAKMLSMPDYIIKAIENHHFREPYAHDYISASVLLANSFLNESIEGTLSTPYDALMPILNEECKKNVPAELRNPDSDEDAEQTYNVFNPNRIFGLLKEEYDGSIISSAT